MEIRDRLIDILKENGIDIFENQFDEELQIDSIQFVSAIVSIEEEFEINIDDFYLVKENFHTFTDFEKLVMEVLSGSNSPQEAAGEEENAADQDI